MNSVQDTDRGIQVLVLAYVMPVFTVQLAHSTMNRNHALVVVCLVQMGLSAYVTLVLQAISANLSVMTIPLAVETADVTTSVNAYVTTVIMDHIVLLSALVLGNAIIRECACATRLVVTANFVSKHVVAMVNVSMPLRPFLLV